MLNYVNYIESLKNIIENFRFTPFIQIIFSNLDYIRKNSFKDNDKKCYIIDKQAIAFTDIYFITNKLKNIKWNNQLPIQCEDINSYEINIDSNIDANTNNLSKFFPFSYTLELIKTFVEYHNFIKIDLDEILTQEEAFYYFPLDHETRKTSHTFFLENGKILRHMLSMFWERAKFYSYDKMYTLGRVYRVDNDATHLPCFYQMDLLQKDTLDYSYTESFIKNLLEYLLNHFTKLFKIEINYKFKLRTRFHYFPYVNRPIEIDCYDFINSRWLELLGGGITNQLEEEFLACGMGLERLCLIICSIMSEYIPNFKIIKNIHNLYDGSFISIP